MIDIHSHILPGVDDGSPDMEESLEMLRMAAESGVKAIAATPHTNIPGMFENYYGSEIKRAFDALKLEIAQNEIPVQLFAGMEVFATRELPDLLKEGRVLTLNSTRYFLTEFSFDEEIWFCDSILDECAEAGFIPVIAHPERYYFVREYPQIVCTWREKGYGIQVNKGSLLGRFGMAVKRTANLLLEHDLVSCVASDAHSSQFRTPHMAEVEDFLIRNYGRTYTTLLLEDNPKKILSGLPLLGNPPVPFRL